MSSSNVPLSDEPPLTPAVRTERGGPRLFLNGEEAYPLVVLSRQLSQTLPNFKQAGIRFIQPVLGLRAGWTGPDQYDWSDLDEYLYQLLESYPDAYFLPRLQLNTPTWWKESHPEELIEYGLEYDEDQYDIIRKESLSPAEGGHYFRSGWELWEASFASEPWQADTAAMLQDYTAHIEESPLNSRIMGYHVVTGTTAEWHNFGPYNLPDYGTPMQNRCGQVPDPDSRLATDHGLLRDPETESHVLDYYECYHDATAEAICTMAEAVTAGSDGRALFGTFYNYLIENVWIQEAGHLAPERVLDHPDVDFLASPYSYQRTNVEDNEEWESDIVDGVGNWLGRARGVAGDGGYRIPVASANRHGKLFIVEIDPSTYQDPEPRHVGGIGSDTIEGTKKLLRRDLGKMFAAGNGGWLYDFGPFQGVEDGWYSGDPILQTINDFVTLGEQQTARNIGSVAETAAVYSADSFYATQHWKARGGTDYINYWFLDSQARSLHRLGAPFEMLYDFDFTASDSDQFDLVFMVNTFFLDDQRIEQLRNSFEGSGTTVVWFYAPGFVAPNRLALDQMEQLTGFQFTELTAPGSMLIDLSDDVAKRTGVKRFGVDEQQWPRFEVTDPTATVLGRWSDRDSSVAFARKQLDGWESYYVGSAPVPAEVLRSIAADSPARLWSSQPDIVTATEDAAMITATKDGSRQLDFHKPLTPRGSDTPQKTVDLDLDIGDVQLFMN